jgi:NADH-quinone oxidoreductase subunit J
MMLDVDFAELRQGFLNYLPVGALVGAILLAELLVVVGAWAIGPNVAGAITAPIPSPSDVTTPRRSGSCSIRATSTSSRPPG